MKNLKNKPQHLYLSDNDLTTFLREKLNISSLKSLAVAIAMPAFFALISSIFLPLSKWKNHNPKGILFGIYFVLFMMGSNFLNAQLTTWELGPASDWNASFVIEGLTDAQCPCLGGAEDHITVYSTSISNPEFEITRPHEQGNWGTTVVIPIGPNSNVTRQGRVGVQNAFQHQSGINCIASCGLTNIGPSMTFTTEALRPPQNVTHVINANGTVTINWDVTTDIPDAIYALVYGWDGVPLGNFNDKSTTTMTICPISDNATFSIWTEAVGFSESEKVYIPMTQGPVAGGTMNGFVKTLSGAAVGGVIVKATLQNPEVFGDCLTPTVYISDPSQTSNGQYSISGIKYHSNLGPAIYDVQAFLEGHEIRDAEDTSNITLNYNLTSGLHDFNSVNFTDITSYVVSGMVISEISGCGLENVDISEAPGGTSGIIPVKTGADGSFNLVVPEGNKTYQIQAKFRDMDTTILVPIVESDTSGVLFTYRNTDLLRGFIGAGCLEVIGQMTLDAKTPNGCLIATTMTNPSGYYEMELPTIPLELQVVDYDPQNSGLDMNDVLNAIDSIYEIDFDSTLNLNIQYRKPIKIDVEGLPPPPCPSVAMPVLNQDEFYSITINIWEEIDICRADTGMVTISDDVSTFGVENPIITEAEFANGRIQYTLRAGDPALSAPFLKYINITAYVDNEVATLSIPVIVSGTRIRTSTITSAPSDSIPFLILRDPPGDGSKAWFSESNMTGYSQSYSHEVGGSVKAWAKAKVGTDFFGVAFWGQIMGSLEVGGSRTSATETAVSMETTSLIETSTSNAFIGEDGDLIMGAAVNFKYGLSDDRLFDLNTCSIVVDTSLVFSPETFESTYIHSVSFIKNDIIPKLDFLSQNQDTTEEARRKFANRLRVWEQILQLNRDQKEEALKPPITTFSFDAGASQTSSITGSSSKQASLEFTTTIDAQIAVEAGVKGFGNELSAGVDVKIRSNWGNSSSETNAITTSTGYTFQDDDPGDSHYFGYAIEPVYGTPVFGVIGGASSCPHEDKTQFIDLMKLTVANPIFVGGPGEDLAIFPFTAQNLGETDATNTYMLDFIEQSNPNSAIVTVNGSMQPVLLELTPGAAITGEIRVTRPSGNQYTFEGLQFDLFSACLAGGNPFPDKSIKSTAYVSAYFMNDCSGINLTAPANNWLINTASNNMIPITMDQYILGNIDQIKLMYASQKDGIWKESNINIPGPNLIAPPQSYMWDVSSLEDGNYTIRWELTCGPTLNWSPRVTGTIDRSAPRVFGVEKPVTDLYFPGDEISVQFNEEIDFSLLNNNHIYMKAIPEGTMFPVFMEGEGNEVVVVPNGDISGLSNQTFEVGVFGIVDLFGNVKTDTAIWEFVISEPDSDRDGVPDTQDRCPGGDDYKDTDMDGLPDDCDCVPTIPTNGRGLTKAALDFDGINDSLFIYNVSGLIPTSNNVVTMEGWIYPKDLSGFQTILASYDNRADSTKEFWVGLNGNKLYIEGPNGNTRQAGTVEVNTWSHFAIVWSQGQTKMYLNKELLDVYNMPYPASDHGTPVSIGTSFYPAGSWPFHGQMEEVRFWSGERSAEQLNMHMNMELEGTEAGLLAYYDFNEGTPFGSNADLTSINDKTSNGHDGTLYGFAKSGVSSNWVNSPMSLLGLSYAICKNCTDTLNTAMDFDGINDKISIPNNSVMIPTTANSMTFETWALRTTTSQSILVHSDSNLYVSITAGGLQIRTGIGSRSWSTNPNPIFPVNEWFHMAVVFDQSTVTVYRNGELLYDQSSLTYQSTNNGSPISLGGSLVNDDLFLNGQMDDVRFWDHVRTEQQIKDHLYTELIGDETGLVAYYNLNEGLPSQNNEVLSMAEDMTGNGNDGTLTNFNQFGSFSNWVKSPLRFSGDVDEDGRPDVCDSCIPMPTLMLENMELNGTYIARDKITLGNGVTFPNNAEVTLRAPVINVMQNFTKPASVKIFVYPNGCEEDL